MDVDITAFNSALNNRQSVILGCSCSVTYSGRAESFLAEGDRIIMIKADKTLLIHQPTGSAPINYMKEGAVHRLQQYGKKLILSSSNLKEFLTVEISNLYSMQILDLSDSEKIQLTGSEKDMSDMIYRKPSLISRDFKPLSREEHTKYGFIDVFGHDRRKNLIIVECKRYAADFNAVDQLLRYIKKIKQLRGIDNVKGVIAAPKITPNALQMLHDHGCEFKAVSPPKYMERHNKTQQNLLGF